ncbi:MAG TPA: hypothetical protein PKD54_03485, partial [Pirellulaceae bacterium]|nr:hypothetical protein [Pirellulaceae bacterium]
IWVGSFGGAPWRKQLRMFQGTASRQKEADPSGVKASSETATNRRRGTVGRASTNGYLVQLILSLRGRGDPPREW